MLLSIIIPIYNIEKYLSYTLENILEQSFADYELLLIDDGSTDGSTEICDKFARLDSRVCVIHQQNAGVSAARNVGVASAKGKYIGFVDGDDLIEPNMFETLVSLAEKHQADIVQCRHNRACSVQGVIISGVERMIDGFTFVRELFDYSGCEYTNQVALWSKIYRRELFSGVIFPNGRTYEDEQETYKICLKANVIVQIPDELYHYVKRENSIITGVSAKKILDKQLALIDRLEYLPKRIPELKENCARNLLNYSERMMCQLYRTGDINTLKIIVDNTMDCKSLLSPYFNKFEIVYFLLFRLGLGHRWVLSNEFEPLQRILSKIKG